MTAEIAHVLDRPKLPRPQQITMTVHITRKVTPGEAERCARVRELAAELGVEATRGRYTYFCQYHTTTPSGVSVTYAVHAELDDTEEVL